MKKLILILIAIFTLSFVSCSNENDFIKPLTILFMFLIFLLFLY